MRSIHLIGAAVAACFLVTGGCATKRTFHVRHHAAGAAGMAGATGGGGNGGMAGRAGSNTGGRAGSSTGGDQGGEGGEGGETTAPRVCNEGSFRCQSNVPQQCDNDTWKALTPCTGELSVCVAGTGECVRAPKSASELVSGAAVVSGGGFKAEVQLGSGVVPTWASGGHYRLSGSAVVYGRPAAQ